jgi:hypothetical protein
LTAPFKPEVERRLLQIAVAVAGIVPVSAGLAGALIGPTFVGATVFGVPADSHFRYLSGLLLGIGIAFWLMIPNVERSGERARLLGAIIVLGGLCRLLAAIRFGTFGAASSGPLVMELIVTPLLVLWQHRVAGLVRGTATP